MGGRVGGGGAGVEEEMAPLKEGCGSGGAARRCLFLGCAKLLQAYYIRFTLKVIPDILIQLLFNECM